MLFRSFREGELATLIDAAAGLGGAFRLDATGMARQLLGDTAAANLLLVGYALQMGWLPVTRASLERAIELNGAAVPLNLRALRVGRAAAQHRATSAASLLRAAGADESSATNDHQGNLGDASLLPVLGEQATLAQRVDVRARFLVGYQGERLAQRYRQFIEAIARREEIGRAHV